MAEKKKSNIWLYISIILIIVVIVLLGIIFLGKENNNSDNFEKKTYCHSLYNKVYNTYSEEIRDHDNTISQFMSNFDFFYSKKTDSCIVSYVINTTFYDNRANSDTYIIKDYLSENNIYYCIQIHDNNIKQNCYSSMLKKLDELK